MVRALLYHPSISIAPQRRSTNEFARWKKDHDRKFSNFHQSARRLFSLLPFLMLHNTEKQALKIFLLPLSLSLLPPLIILWLAICFSFFDTTWPNSEFHRSDCYYCFKFPLSEWLTAFIRSFFAVFFYLRASLGTWKKVLLLLFSLLFSLVQNWNWPWKSHNKHWVKKLCSPPPALSLSAMIHQSFISSSTSSRSSSFDS